MHATGYQSVFRIRFRRCPASNCAGRWLTGNRNQDNAPPDYKFKVFIAGQRRRVTPKIKRDMRRRSAVEPVIGHMKAEHRMDRNYLWYRQGDAINAVLAAAGYNFSLLLRWLSRLLFRFMTRLCAAPALIPA